MVDIKHYGKQLPAKLFKFTYDDTRYRNFYATMYKRKIENVELLINKYDDTIKVKFITKSRTGLDYEGKENFPNEMIYRFDYRSLENLYSLKSNITNGMYGFLVSADMDSDDLEVLKIYDKVQIEALQDFVEWLIKETEPIIAADFVKQEKELKDKLEQIKRFKETKGGERNGSN